MNSDSMLLLNEQLTLLLRFIPGISQQDYKHRSEMLGSSSIGQHVRHVVEMLQCLCQGYSHGVVNYDDRKRDSRIENDPKWAIEIIAGMKAGLEQPDKVLTLHAGVSGTVVTTFNREILYNAEHAIHHMALIKVALRELGTDSTQDSFGMAPATIAYQQQ